MANRARDIARKVRDRWRAKTWYDVLSPEMFNEQPIAETIADEPEKVIGRVCETTMQDVAGDFSKMHIKLYFKVHKVRGQEALTDFIGHEMTSDYIRRMTRRKRSKIDIVTDAETSDGWQVRVKPMAITDKRIKSSQESAIREIAIETTEEAAAASSFAEFTKLILDGALATRIYKDAKPIYPVKRVEIQKSQVLGLGERGSETRVIDSPGREEE